MNTIRNTIFAFISCGLGGCGWYIGGDDGDDRFGTGIALSGDSLAVGAYLEDGAADGINGSQNNALANSGAVYVFTEQLLALNALASRQSRRRT